MSNTSEQRTGIFKGCLFSFIAVLFFIFLISAVFFAGVFALMGEKDSLTRPNINETLVHYSNSKSEDVIAVIPVTGVITSETSDSSSTSCHDVTDIVDYILNKHGSNLKAVILQIDSPGGEVTASDVIYHAMTKIKNEDIPIVVQMESMAASGGYYIACHADHIVANPTTITGSIGVIISSVNVAEGLEKIGIKNLVYKSGDFKDMLSSTREMTEAENIYIQSMVDQSYKRFVKLVSEGRNISAEKLQDMNAIDGRVISGEDALKMGLVDSLGYWEDALKMACQAGDTKDPAVIKYHKKLSFSDLFNEFGLQTAGTKRISVEVGNTSMPTLKPGIPYMLPETHVAGAISAK